MKENQLEIARTKENNLVNTRANEKENWCDCLIAKKYDQLTLLN